MPKLSFLNVAMPVVRRLVHPLHLYRAIKAQRNRKSNRKWHDDAQLQLYAELLPQDYLHFGYFDDPTIPPERTCVGDVFDAQQRYAERVLKHVVDKAHPVLDVGCGMGGLSGILLARGFQPIAMSPDKFQVSHVQKKYPGVKVIRSKFEEFKADDYAGTIGTVLNSESLQYLKLDASIAQVKKLLRPGGRWVICDFFYRHVCEEKSCHVWDEFKQKIDSAGMRITFDEDITENVLPLLRFVHMWATKLGIPMMEFARLKFSRKQPGLHYILDETVSKLKTAVMGQIDRVDADLFRERHAYRLVVVERTETGTSDNIEPPPSP